MDTAARGEVEAAIQEALGHFGVAGAVVIVGDLVELRRGSAAPIAVEAKHVAQQWPVLPPEMRRRKASEIARRLADGCGEARGAGGSSTSALSGGLRRAAPALAVAALVVIGASIKALFFREPAPKPASAGAHRERETEADASARRARVCEASRKQIFAGASIGPLDTEGWVVELWLSTPRAGVDIAKSPAITGIAPGGKLAASVDDALAALPDSPVDVVPGPSPPESPASPGWSSVTLRFAGRYAGAFFEAATRPRFLALADRAASQAGADAGALYARCAHLRFHDAGAWFYGSDAPLLAASLVASMGLFTELPAVARGAVPPGGELDALRTAASKLNVDALSALVGGLGGTMSGGAGDPPRVTMTFPSGGPTRATTASRGVARAIGVGSSTD